MSTKYLVLVSVMTLSGILATIGACSSSTDTATDADAGDSGPTKPAPREAGVVDVPDAGPAVCPSTTPVTAADLAQWQPPPAIQDVCNQQNIDALKAAFKAATTGVKYTDIKTALGVDCAGCAFSPVSGDAGLTPTWSVFVETTGGAYDNRMGSCFARLSTDACGRARYDFEACLRFVCSTTDCVTAAKVTTCQTAAQKGACKAITTDYVAACPNESTLLAACNTYSSIAFSCSGGPDGGAEGGIDAAAP